MFQKFFGILSYQHWCSEAELINFSHHVKAKEEGYRKQRQAYCISDKGFDASMNDDNETPIHTGRCSSVDSIMYSVESCSKKEQP